jgi:demethylmenaquinone methyltransferase/2-methoxy-6-polyprenyl-1,4-benzoquinol methylase
MKDFRREDRAQRVRGMFDRISSRYDLLNRLITFGQDGKWRSDAIDLLEKEDNSWVLDLGTGTGDLALQIAREHPNLKIVALDFSQKMLLRGVVREGSEKIHWLIADASQLPFKTSSFRGIIYAFLLRNVVDLPRSIKEQFRALQPGGNAVCLETTPPRPGVLKPLVSLYLEVIVPLLGKLFAGDLEAYQYLRDTTRDFHDAEELTDRFRTGGFNPVGISFRMLNSIGIHVGKKPA